MKQLLLTLGIAIVTLNAMAQCTPNQNLINPGMYPADSTSLCFTQNINGNGTLVFQNFDVVVYGPYTLSIDSIRIDSITGLPCGIGWQLNKPSAIYRKLEYGCILLYGMPQDTAGIYNIDFHITSWSNGDPSPFPSKPASTIGIDLNAVVTVQGTACNAVIDTVVSTCNNGAIIPQGGYVSGRVYHDANGNNTYDLGDIDYAGATITQLPENIVYYSTSNGTFRFFLGDTITRTLTIDVPAHYQLSIGNTMRTIKLTTPIDSILGEDYALTLVDSIGDLAISVVTDPARPGFYTNHWLVYRNNGTLIADGSIHYVLDTTYNVASVNPINSSMIGNEYSWNFSQLLPRQQKTINLGLYLPPNIDLMGDTLTSTATIWGNTIDADSIDNTFTSYVVVTASYDPNDKTPYPTDKLDEAFIDSGEPLRYRIRFQNTGTDTAFNITVRDTLDLDKFDVSSIHLMGASHEYTFRIEQGNIAIWEFANILLPDSNVNEPGSHGFIMLELDLLPGLGDGDQVLNRAGIYFDFNPVVLTDYATSRVDFSTSIRDVSLNNSSITIFPNPAQNRLVIAHQQWQQGASIVLYDLTGKAMLTQPLNGKTTEVSTANLPNGMYLYQVLGASGIEGLGKVVIAK